MSRTSEAHADRTDDILASYGHAIIYTDNRKEARDLAFAELRAIGYTPFEIDEMLESVEP